MAQLKSTLLSPHPLDSTELAAINPARRTLLASLLSAYAASLVPWALAQPVNSEEEGTFIALSAILVGRQALDRKQAARIHDALTVLDPGFVTAARSLLALINERANDLRHLQSELDAAQSSLAELPRKIVTAWFLGVVGSGERARCVSYESALNAGVVADVLKPPTYAYGAHGSWERKPT